ncbi:MAG TPA: AAA family ATPase [Bacilli bacterium]|jgi:ATP-dependent Clp protease ATP-binding subunit ClpB|nr:AAA family ATPase [Bacilli bacterium]
MNNEKIKKVIVTQPKVVVVKSNNTNNIEDIETLVTESQPQEQNIDTLPSMEPVIEDNEVSNKKEKKEESVDNSDIIKMYGEVLTDKSFVTDPSIARDREINQMILALITPDKSALLVGKPGIGKTALVEGLAYRIHENKVPNALSGWKIIKINIPALLGKTVVNGVEVSKLQLLIQQLDNVEKTILFIDEVHLLVAHNNGNVDLDFANMLKPYLDRGRILMIGATTEQEYRQYVLRDRAFVRRFIKIDIAELQGQDVVKVLLGTYPKFERELGVKVNYTSFQLEKIFTWIVDNTTEYLRIYEVQNRYPDICLTIISSAFSYAVFENSPIVTLKHFYLAMKNTSVIYDDAKTKAINDFKVRFKDQLIKEGINPDLI